MDLLKAVLGPAAVLPGHPLMGRAGSAPGK
jgi:hypothetical protein